MTLLAVALVVSRFQPGVEAGGRTTPPPAGACAGAAPTGTPVQGGARGAWWRLVDRLDGEGTLVGRTLFAGVAKAATMTLDLGVESMASGPKGGLVVVTSDDGRFSDIHLVSAARGCAWLVHHTESVVRSAILDASTGTILAHLVQRGRVSCGTWRIASAEPMPPASVRTRGLSSGRSGRALLPTTLARPRGAVVLGSRHLWVVALDAWPVDDVVEGPGQTR
jgi:hypothetical protein